MCTGIEIAMLASTALGIGSSLFGGGGNDTTIINKTPETKAPAIAAPTSRKSGAAIKLGRENKAKREQPTGEVGKFAEKRKAAVALGGLGRSGLTL